jgi:hypothetical protein
MEKQLRAEREKRAAVLTAEGVRQSKILTAEGEKQSAILTAEGAKQAAILRAEGQAQAIAAVFQAVHDNDPDPKLLAYQYLQTLPQLAQGPGNTFWVIPSEVTTALRSVASAFGAGDAVPTRSTEPARRDKPQPESPAVPASAAAAGPPALESIPAPAATSAPPSASAPPGVAAAAAAPSASAEALSAMLAAAMPGTNFADPLGSIDPPGADAEIPAASQDSEPPSGNGSEPAG